MRFCYFLFETSNFVPFITLCTSARGPKAWPAGRFGPPKLAAGRGLAGRGLGPFLPLASSRDPDPLRDLQVEEESDDDVMAERVAHAIDNESHDPPAVSSLDPGSNSANIRASKAKLTKLFIFTSLGAVGGMVPTSE